MAGDRGRVNKKRENALRSPSMKSGMEVADNQLAFFFSSFFLSFLGAGALCALLRELSSSSREALVLPELIGRRELQERSLWLVIWELAILLTHF